MVCFSFIGFDAITMYSEEAKSATTVPKAIVLALLIGGAIFLLGAWFSQAAFPPTLDGFEVTDDTLPELALKVGGEFFKILFVSAALSAMFASSLSSHASVSRMIYVMARNGTGRIPRFLSYIHPRFLTPLHAVLIVGAVSLLAFRFTLEFVSSMINFGALIAFTMVNLTVLLYFAVHQNKRHTPAEIFTNIVLPVIGMLLTAVLWLNLHFDALLYGAIWFVIGLTLLIYVTRGGLRNPMTMRIEEETLAEEAPRSPISSTARRAVPDDARRGLSRDSRWGGRRLVAGRAVGPYARHGSAGVLGPSPRRRDHAPSDLGSVPRSTGRTGFGVAGRGAAPGAG